MMKWLKKLVRSYAAGEPSSVNATTRPHNRSANQEIAGPFGADSARAYARELVRNNAYAWGVVDTIVSSVIGTGINTMSAVETQDGEDVEVINESRDNLWAKWCKVAELTGQYTFSEVQQIALRECVEAGEVLIHMVTVPLNYRGIKRPVPFALELIEADRLAIDRDTYQTNRNERNRIVRGVEYDEIGKPVAYWVYPSHPSDTTVARHQPVRLEAENVIHFFRKDRVGQGRGVTWFSPVVRWMRDLGLYVDNEMQAGAVASCAVAAIMTDSPMQGMPGLNGQSNIASDGTPIERLEPGLVFRLGRNEKVEFFNPGRPNSGAEPWIALMLRGISVGTGLSYEIVARDFSQTNYSSNRASQLEDRRRFRRWQSMIVNNICDPVWRRFVESATMVGYVTFPTAEQLQRDFDRYAPVEHMTPTWEWVDPGTEQSSSQNSIAANQATYADELGANGKNWRHVFYQRQKEEALLKKLGLTSPAAQAQALQAAQNANMEAIKPAANQDSAGGEMAALSTLQFKRNRKAIETILTELQEGKVTESKAKTYLSSIGLSPQTIDALIQDSLDGSGKLESIDG